MIHCSVTTNGICINPTQNLAPCCKWKFNKLYFGKLRDFSTLQSALDSQAFDELRNRHYQGEFTLGCSSCAFMESKKQRSKRQQYNANIDANTFMLDISIGNFCNLKCRMCNTLNSTAWYDDANTLKNRGYEYSWLHNRETNIISTEDIEKIVSFIETTNYQKIILELKGGEPLALKQTEILLTNISKFANSNCVHIKMITNGTFKPKWLESLTQKFYKFDIHISFDGIDSVYEYIRGDAKVNTYQKFVANCTYFKSLKNCKIRYNIVVQNLNAHQIALIYNIFDKSEINFIILLGPVLLQANHIPEENKFDIVKELIKLNDKHNDSKLTDIINFIRQPADTEMIRKCIEYNQALDNIRGTSLFTVAPHMFEEV